jgi:putative ribosome biogenesis GTPase RsgA
MLVYRHSRLSRYISIFLIYYKYDAQNKFEKFKDLNVDIKTVVLKITNNSEFNKGYLERWLLTKDGKTVTKFIPLSKIFRFMRD